ncbi:MAG: SMI1/KNR4 family protein [Proteobacteria bacterium]|nr:SMI1/KNR4 family protein [Pseudomonadota bacterium]
MTSDITQLIQQHESDGSFTHTKVSNEMLCNAENCLSIKLPEQYKEFLLQYGHGGLDGFEVIGIGKTGKLLFVNVTLAYRPHGLSDNLIVIENCDEWLYCINCNDGCVVCWEHGLVAPAFDCFDSYLLDRLKDSIENM